MLHQGYGLVPGCSTLALGWVISLEKLHQRCSKLLGRTSGALPLEGVPVTVTDG